MGYVVVKVIIRDGQSKIKIDDHLLHCLKEYRQLHKEDLEAGGILVGRENLSNNNLIIEHFTTPQHDDFRSRNKFLRSSKYHLSFFDELYKKNNGTVRYIGEWHTHPEDVPHYSSVDWKNWRKIISKCTVVEAQYHMIIGNRAVAFWKIKQGNFFPKKLLLKQWEEIDEI